MNITSNLILNCLRLNYYSNKISSVNPNKTFLTKNTQIKKNILITDVGTRIFFIIAKLIRFPYIYLIPQYISAPFRLGLHFLLKYIQLSSFHLSLASRHNNQSRLNLHKWYLNKGNIQMLGDAVDMTAICGDGGFRQSLCGLGNNKVAKHFLNGFAGLSR